MKPFICDTDFTLYVGDVRDVLRELPSESVHCCVTSPPYWGLRDYGADGQVGLESTPDEFVAVMVAVFDQVRRVLRPDGTLWLNLGDSYNAYNGGAGPGSKLSKTQTEQRPRLESGFGLRSKDLKPKDLVGIPWRVAFALQADGWYLRSDIVWSKPNPMPESITDRPTKSHEYLFLLTKNARYFYDADAIREPYTFDGRRATTIAGDAAAAMTHENYANRRGAERWPGLAFEADDSQMSLDPDDRAAPRRRHSGNHKRKHGADVGAPAARGALGRSIPWEETDRPQTIRAREIFVAAGLTEEHLAAIRACGTSDAGNAAYTQTGHGRNTAEMQKLADEAKEALGGYYREFLTPAGGRNRRSVWTIATEPYDGAHFATFPQKLVEPCILAGTSDVGCCPECGAPWERETARVDEGWDGSRYGARAVEATGGAQSGGTERSTLGSAHGTLTGKSKTIGWRPTCSCSGVDLTVIDTPTGARAGDDPTMRTGRKGLDRPRSGADTRPMTRYEQQQYAGQLKDSPARQQMCDEAGDDAFAHYTRTDAGGARPVPPDLLERWIANGWLERVEIPEHAPLDPVPCVVLDPFMGSGTTALVARRLGRHSIGIEISEAYASEQIAVRTQQQSLLTDLSDSSTVESVPEGEQE